MGFLDEIVGNISKQSRRLLRQCLEVFHQKKGSKTTFKGQVAPDAIVHVGTAVVLDGPDSKRVADLVRKKYSVMYLAIIAQSAVRRLFGKGSHAADTAIKVTLTK
jgi:hypothetical protein